MSLVIGILLQSHGLTLARCVLGLHMQVKAAEQALAGKVQDSKQWQQMKQMMQQKSREVVELRRRLTKYEPEEISSADAGASAGRGK